MIIGWIVGVAVAVVALGTVVWSRGRRYTYRGVTLVHTLGVSADRGEFDRGVVFAQTLAGELSNETGGQLGALDDSINGATIRVLGKAPPKVGEVCTDDGCTDVVRLGHNYQGTKIIQIYADAFSARVVAHELGHVLLTAAYPEWTTAQHHTWLRARGL